MKSENFIFTDDDSVKIFVHIWLPDDPKNIKAAVMISHGMAEYAARYERFASVLTADGYIVYAEDHRGHGNTAVTDDELGYLGVDGFNWIIKDLRQLNDIIKKENPGIPVYYFGHSMGSIIGQAYIAAYGNSIDGAILSGTMGRQGGIINIGITLAKHEMRKYGPKWKSERLDKLSFGGYNKCFKPARTKFDWLSRDKNEVDKYINDKYCGFVCTAEFYYDFLKGIKEMHKIETMKKIPKELPVYIFSGEKDPVGANCKSVKCLINDYKKLGLKNVSFKFYKDGRHEMLNEMNSKEVMKDVIDWLDETWKLKYGRVKDRTKENRRIQINNQSSTGSKIVKK